MGAKPYKTFIASFQAVKECQGQGSCGRAEILLLSRGNNSGIGSENLLKPVIQEAIQEAMDN